VKPRPNTWFSWFFMAKYDDERWVEIFKMNNILLSKIFVKVRVLINQQTHKILKRNPC
jgi:hypothetical protein